ncbi:Vesicle transport protein, Use1 [Niveomyces insectorum RCEF 264]|uniref:Vesicle transport protein, Use1 n=1 Tax=Niveomyces insectorum RCEF 264 TaxID=1081102 RepID=A0A167QX87_9HYPO|nr:Vesicle transport protein, Use1 [Niveomyces insectorum RCEF 264]
MARTEPLPPFSPAASVVADPYLELRRLLNRLYQNILRTANGERWRRLVDDEFQRLQARSDVAAAGALLARVEQTAPVFKSQARRKEAQAELARHRALIAQLLERLDDLDEEARAAAALAATDDENDDADVDDVFADILPTRHEDGSTPDDGARIGVADNGRQAESRRRQEEEREDETESKAPATSRPKARPKKTKTNRTRIAETDTDATTTPTSQTSSASFNGRPSTTAEASVTTAAAAAAAPTTAPTPQASLRLRGSRNGRATPPADEISARTTSASLRGKHKDAETAMPALMSSLSSRTASGEAAPGETAAVATEENLLDHHRREQEALSEDILRLAQALKEKSLTTSRLLEDDKDIVDRVGEGLHTTNVSLTAASRSMALLSRMTEGKGWWGRMLMLAMVYGLMVLLVLMFLFLPKLRF